VRHPHLIIRAFKIAGDLVTLTAAFVVSVYLSETRVSPGRGLYHFGASELIVLLLLLMNWYFSARFINLYEEFRSRALSFELTAVPEGTRLDFTHADVPEGTEEEFTQGWIDNYWEPMKAYLEK